MTDILNKGGFNGNCGGGCGGMDQNMLFFILLILMCSGGFGNNDCRCR